MINSVLNSVKIIASGRIQVEPRQMPVCMKLGSSSHIEALVSMIELRNQIYTGGPRRLSNCIYATYECICVKYSAKSYVVSTLVYVGFVELFGVRFFTKQSSQRAYFYFHSPYTPGFGSVVHGATAWRLLVTYGCCLWPLDAYVIEPPNRGCLIMLSAQNRAN